MTAAEPSLPVRSITGPLPATWSTGFAVANTIDLDQNKLSGPLPPSWGSQGVFPQLLNLVLGENQCALLTGLSICLHPCTLPAD